MVDLISRWPIQLCRPQMSTPCRANAQLRKCGGNLCLVTHCPQFNLARSATRLAIASFSLSGFPLELGKNKLVMWGNLFLRSLRLCIVPQVRTRERHGALLPVFRPKPPKWFSSHAYHTVAKIHVAPSNVTHFTITETRGEQKFQKHRLHLGLRVRVIAPISSAS